jgi:hypothetical protein
MSKFQEFILRTEAVQDFLPNLFNRIQTDPRLKDPDLWFHFSSIPKLGVNPRASHRDPHGIYMFPKQWVLSPQFGRNHMFFNMPYIFVLKIKPGTNLLNLGTLTRDEAARILTTMGLQDQIATLDNPSRYGGTEPGQILWQILDQYVAPNRRNNGAWNALFKRAGYDGVIDPGTSAIHPNEPEQTIVFNANNLEVVDLIQNNTANAQPNIIIKSLTTISDVLFGRGKYRMESYSNPTERTYKIIGQYQGREFQVYSKHSKGDSKDGLREFSHEMYISLMTATSHGSDSERVHVNFIDNYYGSIQDQIKKVVVKFHTFMDQAIAEDNPEERNESAVKLKEVATEVMRYFGLKLPAPSHHNTNYFIQKSYDWGSFSISVSYEKSSWDDKPAGITGSLNIFTARRGDKPSQLRELGAQIYGNKNTRYPLEMPTQEMAAAIVKLMVQDAEQEIYKHYHPDPDQHSNTWTRYEWADRGRRFLKVLSRIKAIPPIRALLGRQEVKDEYQREIQSSRNQIDLKEYLKGFNTRYPRLAALHIRTYYNHKQTTKPGEVREISGDIAIYDPFFEMNKQRKDETMIKLIAKYLMFNWITPRVIRNYVGEAPLPFGATDLEVAFTKSFIRFFLNKDSLEEHPEWRNLIQAAYMKGMASSA